MHEYSHKLIVVLLLAIALYVDAHAHAYLRGEYEGNHIPSATAKSLCTLNVKRQHNGYKTNDDFLHNAPSQRIMVTRIRSLNNEAAAGFFPGYDTLLSLGNTLVSRNSRRRIFLSCLPSFPSGFRFCGFFHVPAIWLHAAISSCSTTFLAFLVAMVTPRQLYMV